ISNFHIPRWNELPSLDLYLDQLVTFMEKNYKITVLIKYSYFYFRRK
ncbi:MAG: DUF1836 domain-containing protein, partial [Clostridia bacterium]|nr:DUF1836 domain-containing protein [Clostridia bacterium]